jgi:hypothetical protein
LWYGIFVFECYLDISVLEDVGNIPHFRAVTCKCGPFRVVYVFLLVWFLAGSVTLCLLLEFGYTFVGKVVICWFCMVFYSYVGLSFVSGRESIQVM